jgi:hypothetical protein
MAAPVGNQNAKKAKIWEQAIKRALARKANSTVDKGLDALADKLIEAGMSGDPWALKEIGDRVDGKSVQQVEMDGELRTRDVSDKPLSTDEWERQYGSRVASSGGTTEGAH